MKKPKMDQVSYEIRRYVEMLELENLEFQEEISRLSNRQSVIDSLLVNVKSLMEDL